MPTTSLARLVEDPDLTFLEGVGGGDPEWPSETPAYSWEVAGDALERLSRLLVDPSVSTLDAAVAPALELIGESFTADRVLFFTVAEPREKGFSLYRAWSPGGSLGAGVATVLPSVIDAETHPALSDAFAAGRAHMMVAPPAVPFPDDLPGAPPTGWVGSRATLFVPCPSPSGLLGFLAIEAGPAARRWDERALAHAEALGRILSLAIDRIRLAEAAAEKHDQDTHRARLELIGRFASTAAHDLNNVLTALVGYGDLLDLELGLSAGDPGHVELEEMRHASKRAAGVVNGLLRFGRRPREGSEVVDLGQVLGSSTGILGQVLGRGVTLEIDPEPRATPVRMDPARFENALLNLAANARDALGEQGGHFSVSTRIVLVDAEGCDLSSDAGAIRDLRAGRYVRLTARDDGCGIPPEVLPRVFEPFFTSKAPGGGTGLGLPSVAEFVKTERGGMRLESAPGQGTALHFYLPLLAD